MARPTLLLAFRLALPLLFLSYGVSLGAQDSPLPVPGMGRAIYSVSGTVRDASSNRAVDGARVELRGLGGEVVGLTFTGYGGEFSFESLGQGNYALMVAAPGYDTVNETVDLAESSAFGMQIRLRKPQDAHATGGPTISARELSIPHKAHEFMEKAMALLYGKSDFAGSVPQFEKAIKEYPDYYEAYANLGVAYMDMHEAMKSEEALLKAIEMSKQRYPEVYVMLATLYCNEQRFEDAQPVAQKGAELDDHSWQAHYELARALYGLHRDAEAEPSALAAEQLQPGRPELYLLKANIHIHLRKYPLAIEDLTGYLKLEPSGDASDRVRKVREQVQQVVQKAQSGDADSDPENSDGGADSDNEAGSEPN